MLKKDKKAGTNTTKKIPKPPDVPGGPEEADIKLDTIINARINEIAIKISTE